MKKRNKLLVLLLSVAIICAGLILGASADSATPETVSYVVDGEEFTGTIADAIASADEESTVTLLGNCTVESEIAVSRSVTLDLNGYSLTTTTATAFSVQGGSAVFTIAGTGKITSAGTLATVGEETTFAVNGEGNGITIEQTGAVEKNRLVSLTSAYLYMTNVTIESNSGARVGSSGKNCDYTIYNYGNSYISFDKVDFVSTINNLGYGEEGYYFINITGCTTLEIENSAFYTHNFFMRMSEADDATVNVTNSVISVMDKPAVKGGRLGIVFATCERGPSFATINVYDSTLECSGRMFASEKGNGAPEGTSPESISVNAYGTTFKVTWAETDLFANSNAAYLQRNGKSFKLYTSESGRSCKIISMDGKLNQNIASLYAMDAGLRVNLPTNTTATSTDNGIKIFTGYNEDGTLAYTYASSSADDNWVWVYDPIGDADAPYVLVNTNETTFVNPDYSYNAGLDGIRLNQKEGPSDKSIYKESVKNSKYTDAENFTGHMHVGLTRGSLYYDYETANAYVKYVVTPYVDKQHDTEATASDIYGSSYNGKTRNFATEVNKEKTGTVTKTNENTTFIITGKNLSGDTASEYVNTGFATKKVVVVEFDFGTDSAVGFPAMGLQAQSRTLSATNASVNLGAVDMISISNQGNITNRLATPAEGALTKLNLNEWYKVSAVFYTETNTVHLYINGVYMGSTVCYNDTAKYNERPEQAYVQGLRVNVNQSSTQNINAAYCLDNISTRAYVDYQNAETVATATAEKGLGYISTSSPRKYIDDALTVNGRPMASIEDAVAAANGAEIDVNANLNLGDIKVNAVINSNGNTVTFGNGAYGRTEKDGVYTLNENYSYNAYYYTGDVSKLTDGTFTEADFTLFGKVALGSELNISNVYTDKTYDYVNNTIFTQNGWVYDLSATDPVLPKVADASDLAVADENGNVYYLPLIESVPMLYNVKDSAGNGVSAGLTNDEAVNAMVALKDGETFTLFGEMRLTTHVKLQNNNVVSVDDNSNKTVAGVVIDDDYTEEELAAMRNAASDIKIDLNGNKLYTSKIFYISRNVELSVYSSKPGAEIVTEYYKKDGKMIIDRTFGLASLTENGGVETDSYAAMKNNFNAHLNVGTYTDRNGNTVNSENIAITGSFIFDAMTADSSCSINAANVTAARVNSNSSGLVVSRYSGAKMTFKDSMLLVISNGGRTLVNVNYDVNTIESSLYPEMLFDNCVIVTDVQAQNMVSDAGPEDNGGAKNIMFVNCTSSGRLNPAQRNHVWFGEGTASEFMDPANRLSDDLVNAYVWEPMTLGAYAEEGTSYVKVRYPISNADTGVTNYDNYYYIVNNGAGAEFAAANSGVTYIELPVLTTKVVNKSDAVKVVFNKLDGTALQTVNYVKGTDVRAYTSTSKVLNEITIASTTYSTAIMTLTATGWGTLPTNVQEDTVITPEYTAAPSAITGLKANLSLYADFGVNLYIPATYADYAAVSVDGKAVALTSATRGEVDYLVATVSQKCNMAGDDIVYTIALNENVNGTVYTAEITVTISIASYAEKILVGESFTDADKVLMYYMLNYANEAGKYMDNATNDAVAALLTTYAAYGEKYNADNTFGDADTAALAPVFNNVTVDIESTPAFIFTLEEGFEGTVTVAYGNGYNVREYTIDALTDRTLVIEGMKVYNFATVLNITAVGTVNGEDVNVSGTYSFDAFAKYHSENAANDEASAACVALVNALSAYAEVADLYRTGDLADALVVTE